MDTPGRHDPCDLGHARTLRRTKPKVIHSVSCPQYPEFATVIRVIRALGLRLHAFRFHCPITIDAAKSVRGESCDKHAIGLDGARHFTDAAG